MEAYFHPPPRSLAQWEPVPAVHSCMLSLCSLVYPAPAAVNNGIYHGGMTYTHLKGVRQRMGEFTNAITMASTQSAGLIVKLKDGKPVVSPLSDLSGEKIIDVAGYAPTTDTLELVENHCVEGGVFKGYTWCAPSCCACCACCAPACGTCVAPFHMFYPPPLFVALASSARSCCAGKSPPLTATRRPWSFSNRPTRSSCAKRSTRAPTPPPAPPPAPACPDLDYRAIAYQPSPHSLPCSTPYAAQVRVL